MTFEGCRFADPHQRIDIRLGAIRVEGDHSRRERGWETAMLLHHAVAILRTNKTNEPNKHIRRNKDLIERLRAVPQNCPSLFRNGFFILFLDQWGFFDAVDVDGELPLPCRYCFSSLVRRRTEMDTQPYQRRKRNQSVEIKKS